MQPAGHHIALFAHLCCRPEDELDLGSAALCIAEPEYPDLDIAHHLQVLDGLAERVRPALVGVSDPAQQGLAVAGALIEREGFRGNNEAYDDPRNSFLNEVLERRTGIPITLSVVAIEVARRLGVPLYGASFPGHFLLRTAEPSLEPHDPAEPRPGPLRPSRQPLLIDPFTGRALTSIDLKALLQRILGERRDARADELRASTRHEILLRMLNNLRNIYLRSSDAARLLLCTERIRLLEAAMRAQSERGPSSASWTPN